MSSLKSQAEKDAREFTQAKLAYGEGAGNRRKLINETVAFKIENWPGYKEQFDAARERQDVPSMAKHAKRDARRKNANDALVRNTKALMTGKYENANTILLALGGAAVILHKTGYDKVVIQKTKAKVKDLRRRVRRYPKTPKGSYKPGTDGKVYVITDLAS